MSSKVYSISLHVINLVLLVVLILTVIASFSNISEGALSPMNPINISIMFFLFMFWLGSYIFQTQKKEFKWLLPIASIAFISLFLIMLGVVLPNFS